MRGIMRLYSISEIEDVLKSKGIPYDKDETLNADGTVKMAVFRCLDTAGNEVIKFTAKRDYRVWYSDDFLLSTGYEEGWSRHTGLTLTCLLQTYQQIAKCRNV